MGKDWIHLGVESLKILHIYKSLIDSPIVDFYTKNLWSTTLPKNWQISLNNLNFRDIIWMLENEKNFAPAKVFPLSIIALKSCINCYSLNRQIHKNSQKVDSMPNEFKCHLTAKKQHEIVRATLSLLDFHSMCNVHAPLTVVDIGSGQGHLSRYLAGYHNLDVISIDADRQLIAKASEFDEKLFKKWSKKHSKYKIPRKINAAIGENGFQEFFADLGKAPCTLVGLHACGDLSYQILKEFIGNPSIFGVLSLGCCYMKATCFVPSEQIICSDFPLSGHFKEHQPFSFFAKELACHANEQLLIKLKSAGNFDFLKINCYRSTLELILTRIHLEHARKPLKSIKNGHLLNFTDYTKAILNNDVESCDLNSEIVEKCLDSWINVVAYFILRQMLAPLIETVILADRALFVKDNGYDNVRLFPIFDSTISARNIALMAFKSM